MKKIPVIIDCDPGADDALGILLALNSSYLQVLGITTVCGNGTAKQMAKNAAKVCALAKHKEIRVYQGAEQPLKRSLTFSSLYCGEDGLCESGLPDCDELICEKSAGEFLAETIAGAETAVTLVATAGFTNIAEAITAHPEICGGIREIVAASGYFGLNRSVSRAEWNIFVDPEAAEVVFNSGIKVRAVGLDVTAMLQDSYVEELLAAGSGEVCDFFKRCTDYNRRNGLYPYSLLVDGMAVAAAICPEVAEYKTGQVTVHPERNDAGLMSFTEREDGCAKAAWRFDFERYLEMVKGLVKA